MRVVSHSCSNTEMICALGAADWLVGVDDHSDHPPEVVAGLPRIGPDLGVEVERVAALKPDLVVMSDTVPGHDKLISALREAGLPVEVLAPRCLDDVADDFLRLGEWLGLQDEAERQANWFRAQLDALSVSPPRRPVPILVEWWPKPVIAPMAESWVNALLLRAGGINPWASQAGQSQPLEHAAILSAVPEAVVMSWCGVAVEKYRADVVCRRSGWQRVPAVANGRVFAISEAWLGRPGPRLIQGLRALRQVVRAVRAGS